MSIWAIRGELSVNNLFQEALTWVRECTFIDNVDKLGYNFNSEVTPMFQLSYVDPELVIQVPKGDAVYNDYPMDFERLKALHKTNNFVMLGHVSSDAHEGSTFADALDALDYYTMKSINGTNHLMNSKGEIVEKGMSLSILYISYKYPTVDIYTVALNTDIIAFGNTERDLNINGDTIALVGRNEGYQSTIQRLFNPTLNYTGEKIDSILMVDGAVSLNLFSGLAGTLIKPEDFQIRSNLTYEWKGNILEFSLPKGSILGYIHVSLPMDLLGSDNPNPDYMNLSRLISKWEKPDFSYIVSTL